MHIADPTKDRVLDGLDLLEAPSEGGPGRGRRVWAALWPKLIALALVVTAWQVVVWTGWREPYLLPAPGTVAIRCPQWCREVSGRDEHSALGPSLLIEVWDGSRRERRAGEHNRCTRRQ